MIFLVILTVHAACLMILAAIVGRFAKPNAIWPKLFECWLVCYNGLRLILEYPTSLNRGLVRND
jgi:hypothetical protein